MNKLNKHDVFVQAIEQMKASQFKATAIKVELEAQFNRGSGSDCDYCEGSGRERCNNDCDEGYFTCEACNVDDDGNRTSCPDDNCEDGSIRCENGCEDGYFTCSECDGDSEHEGEWGDEKKCHSYMMREMARLGLAKYDKDRDAIQLHGGLRSHWYPIAPLKYAEFYRDGSVDSEFTFTLMLDNPNKVYETLPKVIEMWTGLGQRIGNGIDTTGAGMHMALLNSADGDYPTSEISGGENRFNNFQRSMQLLLPALYFLGSNDDKSRGLNYRRPEVGYGTHRTAIDYRGGAVEFRIFDTCYQRPETILDNVIVMSKCMRFWTTKYTRNHLSKITNSVRFGVDGDDTLQRFYCTREHIDLLNNGLRILKPAYYTIRELKDQRKFNMTKTHINNATKKLRRDAVIEYKEYEQRFSWTLVINRNSYTNSFIDEKLRNGTEYKALSQAEAIKLAESHAETRVKEFEKTKKSVDQYISEKIETFNRRSTGQYVLRGDN